MAVLFNYFLFTIFIFIDNINAHMVGHGAFYLWIEIYFLCLPKWTPHFIITQNCLPSSYILVVVIVIIIINILLLLIIIIIINNNNK